MKSHTGFPCGLPGAQVREAPDEYYFLLPQTSLATDGKAQARPRYLGFSVFTLFLTAKLTTVIL